MISDYQKMPKTIMRQKKNLKFSQPAARHSPIKANARVYQSQAATSKTLPTCLYKTKYSTAQATAVFGGFE